MKIRSQMSGLIPLAIVLLVLGVSIVISGSGPRIPEDDAQASSRGNDTLSLGKGNHGNHNDDDDDDGEGEDEEVPFDEANLYLELNDTDGDLGLHGLIDGDAWKVLRIESPNGRQNLQVMAQGSLRRHGMTELFFESAEPKFPDEIDLETIFDRFPEGEWEISGLTIEGDELESEVELSHVLAEPPSGIMINDEMAAENCDADTLPAVSEPVTIDWDDVMFSHPTVGASGDIEVVKYQLIVEREEPELLVFSVDLPPGMTEFEIPEDFTGLGDEFKLEIIVRTETGNQTAVETCFEIE